MPAVAKKVAKKVAKVAKKSKPPKAEDEPQQNDVEIAKPKRQSLRKIQKTAGIVAAKKLAKQGAKKAVSDKVSCIDFSRGAWNCCLCRNWLF